MHFARGPPIPGYSPDPAVMLPAERADEEEEKNGRNTRIDAWLPSSFLTGKAAAKLGREESHPRPLIVHLGITLATDGTLEKAQSNSDYQLFSSLVIIHFYNYSLHTTIRSLLCD